MALMSPRCLASFVLICNLSDRCQDQGPFSQRALSLLLEAVSLSQRKKDDCRDKRREALVLLFWSLSCFRSSDTHTWRTLKVCVLMMNDDIIHLVHIIRNDLKQHEPVSLVLHASLTIDSFQR